MGNETSEGIAQETPAPQPSVLRKALEPLLQRHLVWLDGHRRLDALCTVLVTAILLAVLLRLFEHIVPNNQDGWAIYWPFDGIVLAVMLMAGRRHWPWIVAGFATSFLFTELTGGAPLSEAVTVILSNLTEILLGAYTLPPFRSLKQWMMEPNVVWRFTLISVLLAPAITGLPVALYFDHTHIGFWTLVQRWTISDALGTALWAPMVFILFSRETYRLFRWQALPRTIALLSILGSVSWYTFSQGTYPIAFLPYPILLFIALRLGFSGAVLGANMLTLVAASLSLHLHGPFMPFEHGWGDPQTVVLQVYSTLAMLFVLPLSVMLIERRNFEEQLQQAYADMKRLATEDQLTGVANRRRFDQVLDVEWKRAERAAAPVALLMIDADCFKLYNDRYGHLAGDECLRQIAKAISTEPLRPHDLVARYGGEEFAVVLSGATTARLEEVANNMRARVEATALLHEGNPHGKVTISVGCASMVPTPHTLSKELIAAADAALYTAKQTGRNRIHNAELIPREEPVKLRA